MLIELHQRFFKYAIEVRNFCYKLRKDPINNEYIKQLIRSSASIGANYIEASDQLGRQDERMKISIARREAKESIYWLTLVKTDETAGSEIQKRQLINEGIQINKILSSILI